MSGGRGGGGGWRQGKLIEEGRGRKEWREWREAGDERLEGERERDGMRQV